MMKNVLSMYKLILHIFISGESALPSWDLELNQVRLCPPAVSLTLLLSLTFLPISHQFFL